MCVSDGVLLVMGSGPRHYREYLLRAIAARHPLWLFDRDELSWQAPYVAGSTVVDHFDRQAAVAAARNLNARVPVRGVLCYHEGVISVAAWVAAELGVAGPSPDAVTVVRDKQLSRERLTRAGLPQPRYAVVRTSQDALDAASAIGFPLVAKPRGLSGSEGVVKVTGYEELGWALGVSRAARQTGMTSYPEILLEQYLPGPEISIDAAVTAGEYLPFAIGRKRLGGEPYFDEVGHTVDARDPLFGDKPLMDMLCAAHAALGWSGGVTHSEVKLTADGPVIVEVNGRLGGDLIPYLGMLANGVDPGRVAADLALGVRPDVRPDRQETAAIRFLRPSVSGTARRVGLPEGGLVPGLHEAVALVEPGARLMLPPEGYAAVARYAYLIACASTAAECDLILNLGVGATVLELDPVAAART